jgi:acyl-coenzyme A synthetase/AMP-(fatty) acid ligase
MKKLVNAAALLLERGDDGRCALDAGSERLTYRELRAAVARAGGAWRERGVEPGDRVVIGLADGIDAVLAHLGAMWIGAVAVAVNPRSTAAQWQSLVDQAQARWVLAAARDALPEAVQARALTPEEWRGAVETAPAPAPLMVAPDTPACWSHSSGTSGSPKAVVHAHRFARAVERVAAEVLRVTPDDRLYASSRLFFVYPLANSLFAGLRLGATVLLDAAWPNAAEAMRVVAHARPSVFFSVPSLLRDLLHGGHAAALARSGLRLVVSAGEALPTILRAAWQRETGIALVNGYGASETMCLVLVDPDGQGLRPAPGVTAEWAEPQHDASLPGRLLVRTPTQALGYWQRPDAAAEHFRATGFCPSDLFERLDADRWRFAGREDSLVKVSGRWVDLVALEEDLAHAAALQGAAAVAVPDADGVQAIALFYVARPGSHAASAVRLAERVKTLPQHQRPRWLHAVPQFPRTPTGKLLRRQLQQMHQVLLLARS